MLKYYYIIFSDHMLNPSPLKMERGAKNKIKV